MYAQCPQKYLCNFTGPRPLWHSLPLWPGIKGNTSCGCPDPIFGKLVPIGKPREFQNWFEALLNHIQYKIFMLSTKWDKEIFRPWIVGRTNMGNNLKYCKTFNNFESSHLNKMSFHSTQFVKCHFHKHQIGIVIVKSKETCEIMMFSLRWWNYIHLRIFLALLQQWGIIIYKNK